VKARVGDTPAFVDQLHHLCKDRVAICSKSFEDIDSDAVTLTDDSEENVLCPYVIVAELQRLAQRELENLLCLGREGR
jgi:hypothetical protein